MSDADILLGGLVRSTIVTPEARGHKRKYAKPVSATCKSCNNETNEPTALCAVCQILRPGEHAALREEFAADNEAYPIQSMK